MASIYNNRIYSKLAPTHQSVRYPLGYYIPGIPHLFNGSNLIKGTVLLATCLISVSVVLFMLVGHVWADLAIDSDSAQNIDLLRLRLRQAIPFKIIVSALSILGVFYTVRENLIDLSKNFKNLNLDKKANNLVPSISFSYCISVASLLVLIFYTSLIPKEVERPLEIKMEFVDNPDTPPVPPTKAKRLAKKNARNTGQHRKKQPVAPGKYVPNAPKTLVRNNKAIKKKTRKSVKSGVKHSAKPQKKTPYKKPTPKKTPVKKTTPKQVTPKPKPKSSSSVTKSLPQFKPKQVSSQSASNPSPKSNPSRSGQTAPRGVKLPVFSKASSQSGTPYQSSGNSNPNNNRGPGTLAARASVDYSGYIRDLQRRISNTWVPTHHASRDFVKVIFNVYKNGRLEPGSIRVLSATSPEAEKAAIKAVLDSAPSFRPLPPGAANKIAIEFKFSKMGVSSN